LSNETWPTSALTPANFTVVSTFCDDTFGAKYATSTPRPSHGSASNQ